MYRQIRLRQGTTTLDLNTSPYKFQAGTWSSSGENLEVGVIIQASTLSQLARYVSDMRRMLARATAYAKNVWGDPVYIDTKVCDDLDASAFFGDTWLRKQIYSGVLIEEDVSPLARPSSANGNYVSRCTLSLQVDQYWERIDLLYFLRDDSEIATSGSDGSITTSAANGLLLPNFAWRISDGLTVRVRWKYSDNAVTFFRLYSGSNVRALYNAGDNKFYMYDSFATAVSSSAQSFSAGDEVDVVFVWNNEIGNSENGMHIHVNGELDGTGSVCRIYGSLATDLLTNDGFETFTGTADDGTSDTWTGWTRVGVDDAANNKMEASTTAQAGTYAIKFTRSNLGDSSRYVYQDVSVIPGATYYVQMYARGDGSADSEPWFFLHDQTNDVPIATGIDDLDPYSDGFYWSQTGNYSTSYSNRDLVISVPDDCETLRIGIGFCSKPSSGTVTAYFDSLSVWPSTEPVGPHINILDSATEQTLYSLQVWEKLTKAEAAGLYNWGRPLPQLMYLRDKVAIEGSSADYNQYAILYNTCGDVTGPCRVITSKADNKVLWRYGYRPLRVPDQYVWECESGTMGTDTAATANAALSNGNVARFTPTGTSYATRVTLQLAADATDVAGLQGDYRLFIAVDASSGLRTWTFKYRLVVAGQALDYCEEVEYATDTDQRVLDMGTLSIPPSNWPEDVLASIGTDYSGANYLSLEIQAKVDSTSGSPYCDIDALILVPAEIEGSASGDAVASTDVLVDFSQSPASCILVYDSDALEFAEWWDYEGDVLELVPILGGVAGFAFGFHAESTAGENSSHNGGPSWQNVALRPRYA